MTDFGDVVRRSAASAMGMPTPVAYKVRRGARPGMLARGMNFAVGGAGVLDTGNFQRNISAQIDLFQALQAGPQRRRDNDNNNNTWTALVVVSGNDYSYASSGGASNDNNGTSVLTH